MNVADFDYELPEELIAQKPCDRRDGSRLLVVDRKTGTIKHEHFYDIEKYLRPDDCLVLNDSKVIPARLFGTKDITGAKIEFLLTKRIDGDIWETMVRPGKRLKPGDKVIFEDDFTAEILENGEDGTRIVRFDYEGIFMQRLDQSGIQQLVVELCKERLPSAYGFDPLADIQVLSPTKKSGAGTIELNKKLQSELNPPSNKKSEIKAFTYTFRTGDKVMQTKNDYDIVWAKETGDKKEQGTGIFNGDIGHIVSINKFLKTAVIDFDGRVAVYNYQMLENIELAYAVTVHKSQGSEFDAVILTVFTGYDKLYYRNLLYTAVTRAKKLLIIVGSSKRVEFMINNNIKNQRFTCLKDMLKEQDGDEADIYETD